MLLTRAMVTWLLAFLVSIVALHFLTSLGGHSWKTYYELKHSGRSAVGQVTRVEPGNHQTVDYAFNVGSTRYSGTEAGHSLEPQSTVTVIYLPRNPEISCLDDPAHQFVEQVAFIVMASAVLATAIAFTVWRRNRVR